MDLARSSLKLFTASITSAVLQFLGLAYFARVLGPSPMGVFFLFQALLGMLAIPADFGIRGAVEKRISEGESPGSFLSSAFLLKLAPIAVIVSVILLSKPLINDYLGRDLAVLLAVGIVLQEVAQLAVVVLKGELRVGETAVLKLARQGVWLGVSAVFVSWGFSSIALVYGLLASLGIVLIWGWFKVSVTPSFPSRQHTRSLFIYSKPNVLSSIGGYFYS
jgi:O-antigen/teichoic acid export membrane protein